MMNEICTPVSDTLNQSPWNLRYTTFRLGPLWVHFVLKDLSKLPPHLAQSIGSIEDHRTGKPFQFQRFIVFCIVGEEEAYILNQFNTEEEATVIFKDFVQRLKYGEDIEITDQAGIFSPLQLSYRGIKWIWE